MSLIARLAAVGLGAGILFTGAGSALAAPAEDTSSTEDSSSTGDSGSSEYSTSGGDAASSSADSADTGSREVANPGGPAGGPAPTYVLEGVGVPFADPSLGVPKVLEAGILPLGLLADAVGEQGATATENGAQGTPGSAES